MPIRPENKERYPADWQEIRAQVLARAKNCCECIGECGYDHDEEWRQHMQGSGYDFDFDGRCYAVNHEPHFVTGSHVVLTIAHLDHTPENCDQDTNLRAFCQRCHLAYDRDHHRQTRARRRYEAANTLELFEETGE